MSIYSYQNAKVIDRIRFRRTEAGAVRAYLHASPNTRPDLLNDIMCKMQELGWQCLPYTVAGQPELEVRGFKRENALITELLNQHYVEGTPQVVKEPQDHISFKDILKKRTLQASGVAYLIGDACFATYGYKESHWEDVLAGAFYFGGSSALIGYGRNDQSDLQIKDIAKKMKEEMKKQSVNLPENCSLNSIAEDHKKGLIHNIDELLRRYPAETMNTFFALAGVCIATAAVRHKVFHKLTPGMDALALRKMKQEGWLDVGLGTMTTAAGAVSVLVEEKARDPDEPLPTTITGKVRDFVEHRPLSVAGMGYIVSTMCHAVSTYIALKEARRLGDAKRMASVPFRAVFVGANLVAEVLMAVSSKGHGKGVKSDNSVDESVISLTADLIVKQPAHMHNQLIDYMSKFLGRSDILAIKDKDAARQLRVQVEAMKANPWAKAESTRTPRPVTSASLVANSPPHPAWQTKIAAADPATPQPHL